MTEYKSRHGIVSKAPYELYMVFNDPRNLTAILPAQYRDQVTADYDSATFTLQGYRLGVKVFNRAPYALLEYVDAGAPFAFRISLHFDAAEDGRKTDFSICVEAELNMMMKIMLGKRIQEGLDRIVDAVVALSEGRMPEGIDPEELKKHFPGSL